MRLIIRNIGNCVFRVFPTGYNYSKRGNFSKNSRVSAGFSPSNSFGNDRWREEKKYNTHTGERIPTCGQTQGAYLDSRGPRKVKGSPKRGDEKRETKSREKKDRNEKEISTYKRFRVSFSHF